jgi:hypothetical protein
MTLTPPPDESSVRESIDRIERTVLEEIRTQNAGKRRLRFGLAALGGVALFAGGVAVGGAALAPVVAGGTGSGPVFTVDCYNSVGGHLSTSVSFSVATVYRQVRTSPVGVCVQLGKSSGEEASIERKISQLNARGTVCGYIEVKGGSTVYFDGDGRSTGGELAVRSGCSALFQINAFSSRPLVACRESSSRVAVYPLGKETAAVVCGHAKLTVWTK